MNTFTINYGVWYDTNKYKTGIIKVKNATDESHAKEKLSKYLKSKMDNVDRITVSRCVEDKQFNDPLNYFRDIFGF